VIKIEMRNRYLSSFILAALLIIINIGLSCSNGYDVQIDEVRNNKYTQITVQNQLGSYSFEYPSYYEKKVQDNFDFIPPYSSVVLLGPTKVEEVEVFDPDSEKVDSVVTMRISSSIEISITDAKKWWGENHSAINTLEELLIDEAKWDNFQLINRSLSFVSELEGEKVEYFVDKLMPIPKEDGKNLEYVCAIFFDYNGLIWEIRARGDQEIREELKTDFDNIVETFTILD
jgi:hypothetical protein